MAYPNIAAERVRKGWSQEDLARILGVSRKTLYNWERAGRIPAVALDRMADIFGVTVDYLLSVEAKGD